jgi:hypothetical protein
VNAKSCDVLLGASTTDHVPLPVTSWYLPVASEEQNSLKDWVARHTATDFIARRIVNAKLSRRYRR